MNNQKQQNGKKDVIQQKNERMNRRDRKKYERQVIQKMDMQNLEKSFGQKLLLSEHQQGQQKGEHKDLYNKILQQQFNGPIRDRQNKRGQGKRMGKRGYNQRQHIRNYFQSMADQNSSAQKPIVKNQEPNLKNESNKHFRQDRPYRQNRVQRQRQERALRQKQERVPRQQRPPRQRQERALRQNEPQKQQQNRPRYKKQHMPHRQKQQYRQHRGRGGKNHRQQRQQEGQLNKNIENIKKENQAIINQKLQSNLLSRENQERNHQDSNDKSSRYGKHKCREGQRGRQGKQVQQNYQERKQRQFKERQQKRLQRQVQKQERIKYKQERLNHKHENIYEKKKCSKQFPKNNNIVEVPIQKPKQKIEPPQILLCPITQILMNSPYLLTTCGHTFQEQKIRQWLKKQNKCPLCNQASKEQNLIKNFALAEVCRTFK